jgi:hypothetical protein
MDAINAGYDEITHINWVIMQAMPDDVIKIDNGIMRFEGPGRYARNVDLDAEPMKTIVATMAAKKIYSDPTMVAFEGLYVPENGDLSPLMHLLSEHYRPRPNAVFARAASPCRRI